MVDRANIKVSRDVYEELSAEKGGETWDAFLTRLVDNEDFRQEQLQSLELISGMMMLEFDSRDDRPDYSPEALEREARFFARGGDVY